MEDEGKAEGRLLHRERAEAATLDRGKEGPPRHPGVRPGTLLDVAVGGAVGALARYLIVQAMPGAQRGFPWGTLLVNVLGCLIMGVLTTYLLKDQPRASSARCW